MNFEQEISQCKDTSLVVAEIQRRQAEKQMMQAEGLALHEQRMNYSDVGLSEITDKREGLTGLMDAHFRRPPN